MEQYENTRRRSPHEDCISHSALETKVHIQILFSGIGLLLMSTLLMLVIDTHSTITSSSQRLAKIEIQYDTLHTRIRALEIEQIRYHRDEVYPTLHTNERKSRVEIEKGAE